MQTIRQAELHLLDVTTERLVYQGALEKAKLSVVPYLTIDGTFSPPPPASKQPANKTPISAHYSFDMAQQVFYPNNPLQPGPMYFNTTKVCDFGVCYEAIPRQINCLIDEAVDMGKGSNAIVSMYNMGWVRRWYTCTPTTVVGRTRTRPWCSILWRVLTGQHKHITLSFMIPGHTKFIPDWCFGHLKKKYRRTKVGGLTDLVGVVNESASVNTAQPTGLEDGSVLVTMYNWQEYFKTFCTKVNSIKKLHHLQFD